MLSRAHTLTREIIRELMKRPEYTREIDENAKGANDWPHRVNENVVAERHESERIGPIAFKYAPIGSP
jgi:hypothetical protein